MSSKYTTTDQMAAKAGSQSGLLQPSATGGNESPTDNNSNGTDTQKECTNRANKNATVTVVPSPQDILCGRGLHIMNREGNLSLHLLVNKYREKYLQATRRAKAEIIRHIVEDIKSTGARFLGRIEGGDDDRCVEVDDKTASKKVSHALRLRKDNHGKKFLKATELQQSMSSSVTTRAQTITSTPSEATAIPPIPQNDPRGMLDLPLSFSHDIGLAHLPLPPYPPYQLRSLSMATHPVTQLSLQAQAQSLLALPWYNVGLYANAIDPWVFANAFTPTLAMIDPATHQPRSSIDREIDSLQPSWRGNVEERRKL